MPCVNVFHGFTRSIRFKNRRRCEIALIERLRILSSVADAKIVYATNVSVSLKIKRSAVSAGIILMNISI